MSLIEYARCPHGHGRQQVVETFTEGIDEPGPGYTTRSHTVRVVRLACECEIVRETGEVIRS